MFNSIVTTMFLLFVFSIPAIAAPAPPAKPSSETTKVVPLLKSDGTPAVPIKTIKVRGNFLVLEASPEFFQNHSWVMPIEQPTNPASKWKRKPTATGLNFNCARGTRVRATATGKVLFTGWYGGYGRVIILDHGEGLASLYAHLSKSYVSLHDEVSQGQTIGVSGSTGFSEKAGSLYFEVRKDGKPISQD